MQQALNSIYKKKQPTQGYGQQTQKQYNYGGYAGTTNSYLPEKNKPQQSPVSNNWANVYQNLLDNTYAEPSTMYPGSSNYYDNVTGELVSQPTGVSFQQQTTQQPSPISEALLNYTQNLPTSWDWQGGEASPYGIRTPWLAYQWHYDDPGVVVPNNPDNPFAPWNMPNTTQTYEDWYSRQQPSPLFNRR